MKIEIISLLLFTTNLYSQGLDTIFSVQIDSQDYRFETTIEDYHKSDNWRIWSYPIGKVISTSELKAQGRNSYAANNIQDNNLNTAWVEGDTSYGIGAKFSFTFDYKENHCYGSAYQFFGRINLFNGYCKSLSTWKDNSRVRTLKVYYNNRYICVVELLDTWQLQTFDIGKYFKNNYLKLFLEAKYEIKSGDILAFEIADIYKGDKYSDVAITEFAAEGAKN